MRIKRKFINDAGVNSPNDAYEINDQGGVISRTPRSGYAISESQPILVTAGVGETYQQRYPIADGNRVPGSMRTIGA